MNLELVTAAIKAKHAVDMHYDALMTDYDEQAHQYFIKKKEELETGILAFIECIIRMAMYFFPAIGPIFSGFMFFMVSAIYGTVTGAPVSREIYQLFFPVLPITFFGLLVAMILTYCISGRMYRRRLDEVNNVLEAFEYCKKKEQR